MMRDPTNDNCKVGNSLSFKNRRKLWQSPNNNIQPLDYYEDDLPRDGCSVWDSNGTNNTDCSAYEDLWHQYARRPDEIQSWFFHMSRTLVVSQEISLAAIFLSVHRMARQGYNCQHPEVMKVSILVLWITFLCFIVGNSNSQWKEKVYQRLTDAGLMAIVLKFLASLLKSLLESQSDSLVSTLALVGMTVHVFLCDYAYANGEPPSLQQQEQQQHDHERPPFRGGTLSLNAVFFVTLLLMSRYQHYDEMAFAICLLAAVFFAFFPLARHQLSQRYPPTKHAALAWITLLLGVDAILWFYNVLDPPNFRAILYLWIGIHFFLLVIVPTWKCYLQFYKVSLEGPWDIPFKDSMLLDSSGISCCSSSSSSSTASDPGNQSL